MPAHCDELPLMVGLIDGGTYYFWSSRYLGTPVNRQNSWKAANWAVFLYEPKHFLPRSWPMVTLFTHFTLKWRSNLCAEPMDCWAWLTTTAASMLCPCLCKKFRLWRGSTDCPRQVQWWFKSYKTILLKLLREQMLHRGANTFWLFLVSTWWFCLTVSPVFLFYANLKFCSC